MSAIILDGELKSALAAVRSLGRQKIAISCGAQRHTALACHSALVCDRFVYHSPKTHQEKFIDDVVVQAKKLKEKTGEKPVIFCFSDATCMSVAYAYDRLSEHANVLLPDMKSLEIAGDKQETYACARALAISTITTYAEEAFDVVAYPAVVKNRHSIVWKEGKPASGSAHFVFSRAELDAVFKRVHTQTGEKPLVQEFIKGDEYGIEMVCEHGSPLAVFSHKRIRSLSPRGGAAVVKETAPETEAVVLMQQYARALASQLQWHGPIMVEFKVDTQDGRVLLMEINGRFWGSLPLAVASGIDFPLLAYELAHSRAKAQETFSPHYARTRHFLGDCKWLLGVFFARDPLRATLYPSRLQALWAFKTEFFKSRGDIFAWNDPVPAFYEYIDILNRITHIWKSKA